MIMVQFLTRQSSRANNYKNSKILLRRLFPSSYPSSYVILIFDTPHGHETKLPPPKGILHIRQILLLLHLRLVRLLQHHPHLLLCL